MMEYPVSSADVALVRSIDDSLDPLSLIGQGKSKVFLCRNGTKNVVLKQPGTFAEYRALKALEGVDHVVQMVRAHTPTKDKRAAIVKEYVEGETLLDILAGRTFLERKKQAWEQLAETAERHPWTFSWDKSRAGVLPEERLLYHRFNGNGYEPVAEAGVPSPVKTRAKAVGQPWRLVSDDGTPHDGTDASNVKDMLGGLKRYMRDGAVEPELFPWTYQDGTIYCEGAIVAAAADVTGQLTSGLEQIHERGVAGIDIKPSNVMIGRNGVAYYLDFDLNCFARFPRLLSFSQYFEVDHYINPAGDQSRLAVLNRFKEADRKDLGGLFDKRKDGHSDSLVLHLGKSFSNNHRLWY